METLEKVTIHHPRGRLQADVPASAVTHWFAAGWQTGPLPPAQKQPADTEPAPEPETQPELEPEPEPARPRSGRRRTGSTTT